jgi:hypothetical protein
VLGVHGELRDEGAVLVPDWRTLAARRAARLRTLAEAVALAAAGGGGGGGPAAAATAATAYDSDTIDS